MNKKPNLNLIGRVVRSYLLKKASAEATQFVIDSFNYTETQGDLVGKQRLSATFIAHSSLKGGWTGAPNEQGSVFSLPAEKVKQALKAATWKEIAPDSNGDRKFFTYDVKGENGVVALTSLPPGAKVVYKKRQKGLSNETLAAHVEKKYNKPRVLDGTVMIIQPPKKEGDGGYIVTFYPADINEHTNHHVSHRLSPRLDSSHSLWGTIKTNPFGEARVGVGEAQAHNVDHAYATL